MNTFMAIRSGIFLVGGLVAILFRNGLNNIKNNWYEKLGLKRKDERKFYIYLGITMIGIAVILFGYSITH